MVLTHHDGVPPQGLDDRRMLNTRSLSLTRLLARNRSDCEQAQAVRSTGEWHQIRRELCVVFCLELIKALRELGLCANQRTHPHKCPHDLHVHAYSSFAVQDRGEHRHSLLGERKRKGPTPTTPGWPWRSNDCPFGFRELKDEVVWKSIAVAPNRLQQCTRLNGIHHCKITVQKYPESSQLNDS